MNNNDEFESVDQDDLDQDVQDDQLSDMYKFWTLTVAPGDQAELEEPEFDAVIRVTMVSFGLKVEKSSRSVLLCKDTSDEEKSNKFSPLCVLSQGGTESLNVDLRFDGPHTFAVKGTRPSTITLSGFLEPRAVAMGGGASDLDPAGMDMQRRLMQQQAGGLDDLPSGEEDEQDDEAEASEASEASPPPKPAKKAKKPASAAKKKSNGAGDAKKSTPTPDGPKPKKRKLNEVDAETEEKQTPASEKKPSPAAASDSGKKKSKAMKHLKMGVMYRDIREGKGKEVAKGSAVRVKYVGQLENGSVFDKCLSADGFSFTLGEGEVIKGWDVGVAGLKVGAKRKLKIPPKLAYGAAGSPPKIPKNATLTFTIEVLDVE